MKGIYVRSYYPHQRKSDVNFCCQKAEELGPPKGVLTELHKFCFIITSAEHVFLSLVIRGMSKCEFKSVGWTDEQRNHSVETPLGSI